MCQRMILVGCACILNCPSANTRRYASDLGKAFGCPIFHVNADDVEAVNRVFELAGERVIKVDIYI